MEVTTSNEYKISTELFCSTTDLKILPDEKNLFKASLNHLHGGGTSDTVDQQECSTRADGQSSHRRELPKKSCRIPFFKIYLMNVIYWLKLETFLNYDF